MIHSQHIAATIEPCDKKYPGTMKVQNKTVVCTWLVLFPWKAQQLVMESILQIVLEILDKLSKEAPHRLSQDGLLQKATH